MLWKYAIRSARVSGRLHSAKPWGFPVERYKILQFSSLGQKIKLLARYFSEPTLVKSNFNLLLILLRSGPKTESESRARTQWRVNQARSGANSHDRRHRAHCCVLLQIIQKPRWLINESGRLARSFVAKKVCSLGGVAPLSQPTCEFFLPATHCRLIVYFAKCGVKKPSLLLFVYVMIKLGIKLIC